MLLGVLLIVVVAAVILFWTSCILEMEVLGWSTPLLLVGVLVAFVVMICIPVTVSSLSSTLSAFSLLLTIVTTSFDASLSVFETVVSVSVVFFDESLFITAAGGWFSAVTLSFGALIDLAVELVIDWLISVAFSVGVLAGLSINGIVP